MADWTRYYERVGERPNPLVVDLLERTECRDAALDLGAGNFRDSKFLLHAGFKKVVAVDSEQQSSIPPGIEFRCTPLELFVPEHDTYDYVVSCNTLFFLSNEEVDKLIERIFAGMRKRGVFVCNVLGEWDAWAVGDAPVSWFTAEDIAKFRNVEEHGELDYVDDHGKYWHQRTLIFRKP
jgi:hypothetical protein